jgi:type I restriction enzyme S subunit
VSIALALLGDIATLQAGFGFPPNLQGRTNGQYPFAKVGDISRGGRSESSILSKADHYVDAADVAALRAKLVPPGSILFAKIGEAIRQNHRVVAGCEMLIDNNAMAAIPTARVASRFLYHYLKTVDFYCLAPATTVPALRKSDLEKLKVPLPPLPEQRRIAAILDQADALRAKRREALAQLDSLTQSIFIEMFGDFVANPKGFSVSLLGKVCDVRDGTHDSPKYVTDGYPLVTSKNLSGGYVDLTDVNLISERDYDAINKRSKVDRGDLLMPMIGTIGNPVLIEDDPAYAVKNVAIVKFPRGSPSNIFIRAVLSGAYFDHVVSQKNRGGTQKFLSLGDLRSIPVPLPQPGLQHTFATRIQAVESLKTTHRAARAESDAMFASLQHRAFNGGL